MFYWVALAKHTIINNIIISIVVAGEHVMAVPKIVEKVHILFIF